MKEKHIVIVPADNRHNAHDHCVPGVLTSDCSCGCETGIGISDFSLNPSAEIWQIPNMDCHEEEKAIRKILNEIRDIHYLAFDLPDHSLTIDATKDAREEALKAIKKAGYHPENIRSVHGHDHTHGHAHDRHYWKSGIALLLALGAEILHAFFPHTRFFEITVFGISLLAILLAGISVYLSGINSLLHGRININVLMAVAVTGALLLGQWAEAAMVMVLYSIAELIEAKSVDRARQAICQLLNLTPEMTERKNASGKWEPVHVGEVRLNEIVRIRPGESIPLDGVVESGFSAVNQMPITGESIAVTKMTGDKVYAGSISESGFIELRVTATARDTMLSRIISIVEKAQKAKAPTERFVDRFASVYTPAVFLIAVVVAVSMPVLFGMSWKEAIYRALVLLVISCPCAFVIATPLAIVCGLTAAARAGILIKGGIYLEEAKKIKSIAFDKTGTITQGQPKLVAMKMFSETISDEQILSLALTVTSHSSHPVSRAIFHGITGRAKPGEIADFTEYPGKGVMASMYKKRFRLGKLDWIKENISHSHQLDDFLKDHENSGCTFTILASDEKVLAVFAVADMIRATSEEGIRELKSRNVVPVMLTGDNIQASQNIASQAGIVHFQGDLLPEDKLAAIRTLQAKYKHVGMVGDGINDAPALATADVGIAMGGIGTGIAMETADVVIMNDDIRKVGDLIGLSRQTFSLVWQNIIIALGIKTAFFGLALLGYADMWMAVFADVGATLIVVFNGLRLLGWKSRFL